MKDITLRPVRIRARDETNVMFLQQIQIWLKTNAATTTTHNVLMTVLYYNVKIRQDLLKGHVASALCHLNLGLISYYCMREIVNRLKLMQLWVLKKYKMILIKDQLTVQPCYPVERQSNNILDWSNPILLVSEAPLAEEMHIYTIVHQLTSTITATFVLILSS